MTKYLGKVGQTSIKHVPVCYGFAFTSSSYL